MEPSLSLPSYAYEPTEVYTDQNSVNILDRNNILVDVDRNAIADIDRNNYIIVDFNSYVRGCLLFTLVSKLLVFICMC